MELTDQEKELIMQIRNYKNSKHNPSRELRAFAKELFDTLMDE